ncbi:MAG: phage integrase SAM-like domain-containing protein [Bacteroidia bacterium]
MKVTLRTKTLKDGRESYYLDIYVNGQRHYEFLKLYLLKQRNLIDRDVNKVTTQQAEKARAEKQLEIQNSKHGLIEAYQKGVDFLQYFDEMTKAREKTGVDKDSWRSVYNHLKKYMGTNRIAITDIDENWIEGFRDYLLYSAKKKNEDKISRNSAHHYFNRLKNCFKKALRDKVIKDNPADRVDYIPLEETKREFLTFEELQLLFNAECRSTVLKSAFLFSALTGLRWSDIEKLTWEEVQHSEDNGWGVYYRQQKTEAIEFLPISDQARDILGPKGRSDQKVFAGLSYSVHTSVLLQKWCSNAGIKKEITFHSGRHTAATLLISNDVNLYTVQKLLGHKNIKTTEVYAKLVDKKKIEAVNKIPQLNFK